jgi:4'-phosphopantetheinyl transferase
MQHSQAKSRFVRVRAELRRLLGQYLDCHPASISFTIGEHGKPRLVGTAPNTGLVFNLSHCGDCALIGFGLDTALGLDVEQQRRISNLDGLARRCFAAEEWAWWQNLPPDERVIGFLRVWTGKEALVKASGEGIRVGLRNIALDLAGSARFIALPTVCGLVSQWHLHEIDLGAGVCAAVCHDGAKRRLLVANGADCVTNG